MTAAREVFVNNQMTMPVRVHDDQTINIHVTHTYKYLGGMIDFKGGVQQELRSRLGQGFSALQPL